MVNFFGGPITFTLTPEEGHQIDRFVIIYFLTIIFIASIILGFIINQVSKHAKIQNPKSKNISPAKTLIIATALYLLVCYYIYAIY
jgi:uncharacterized membrane protein YjgN (DUF898 family)